MITFDPLTIDFMLERASRIEARLRYALLNKASIDLGEVQAGLTLDGYREAFKKNGITIEHITPLGAQFDLRLDTYRVFKYGELVDQFQVDYYGIIKDDTDNEAETSH